jgi:hypothetical protein
MWISLKSAGGSGVPRSPGPRAGPGSAASVGVASPMGHGRPEALVEVAPMGCALDAYKLFVGNIPKHCTEAMLRPMFESVGQVRP